MQERRNNMDATDKIYLFRNPIGVILGSWYMDSAEQFENIEYIRKDALIEWAESMKRICQGAEPLEKAYQTVIDKLNSM